jgi:hypothetical protein
MATKVPLTVGLDAADLERLRALSAATGAPVAELVRRAVRRTLDLSDDARTFLREHGDHLDALSDEEVRGLARALTATGRP